MRIEEIVEERVVQAAFRDRNTGKIYKVGPCHDINYLPDDDTIDLEALISGFVTDLGRFLTKEEMARLKNHKEKKLHSEQIRGMGPEPGKDYSATFGPAVSPHLHEKASGEKIVQAAFKDRSTGKVYSTGAVHDYGMLPDGVSRRNIESGFVTNKGRFLNQIEAARAKNMKSAALYSEQIKGLGAENDPTDELVTPDLD